jgi:hypothetical protein
MNAVSVEAKILPLTLTCRGAFDSRMDGNSCIVSTVVLCPYRKMMNDVRHDNYNIDELFFPLFFVSRHRISMLICENGS